MKDATKVGTGSGAKFDGDKPRWDLLPLDAVEEVVKVLTRGAAKYSENNWREGMRWQRPLAACMRHLRWWQSGQSLDNETGISHLAHAACNLLFGLWYELNNQGEDDRWATTRKSNSKSQGRSRRTSSRRTPRSGRSSRNSKRSRRS